MRLISVSVTGLLLALYAILPAASGSDAAAERTLQGVPIPLLAKTSHVTAATEAELAKLLDPKVGLAAMSKATPGVKFVCGESSPFKAELVTIAESGQTGVLLAEGTKPCQWFESDGTALQERRVTSISPAAFYIALCLIALLVLLLPWPLFNLIQGEPVSPWQAWRRLLVDKDACWSAGRLQLALWFVPAGAAYFCTCWWQRGFAPIDSTLATLLGLSAATALIAGTAAVSKPDTTTDDNFANFTRMQIWVVASIGSAVLSRHFLATGQLGTVPASLMAVVGGSQALYVGAKWWSSRDAQPNDGGATGGVGDPKPVEVGVKDGPQDAGEPKADPVKEGG